MTLSCISYSQKAFDANPSLNMRVIFANLSKAFDKVWNKGLMDKLNNWEYVENSMDQRVVLSRQSGTWSHIEAVVSQAFILRPLLFLIHISVPVEA